MRRSRLLFTVLVFPLCLSALPSSPAQAGESAALTRRLVEAEGLSEGERVLSERLRAEPGDDEARFGLGMVQFARAFEKFGQHHYRYGLKLLAEPIFPFLRMPVPHNDRPERLTYEVQRAALQTLLDDLAVVETTLAGMGQGDLKIVLDLEKVRLDVAGTGDTGPATTLMNALRSVSPMASPPGAEPQPAFEIAFDRADAPWLRGYSRLLSAGLEFVLAYDWRDTFAKAGGLFYPNLQQDIAVPASSLDALIGDTGSAALIADTIAMIHEIRWQPVEPARLLKTRDHLKQVARLSRESWTGILAETDDDREWIPAPRQKNGVLPTMTVTQERVDIWFAALDDFDAVLDGRKLLPHWRLEKGINLRRVFEEPRPFDIVLWATGHAAVPYLEDGPIIPPESWQLWQQVFEGDFLAFAIYFN